MDACLRSAEELQPVRRCRGEEANGVALVQREALRGCQAAATRRTNNTNQVDHVQGGVAKLHEQNLPSAFLVLIELREG